MAWWSQHIDAVITITIGAVASLMGAGILRISKAANASTDGRVRKIRLTLAILGPGLVGLGMMRIFLASPPRPQWHQVTGDGKFSIMLPYVPEAKDRLLDSPLGQVVVHGYVASSERKDADYRIRYTDLPAPASYENATGPLKPDLGNAKAMDFTETAQTPTTVSGYPAMIVDGTGPGGLSLKMKYVWVGPRQYVMIRTIHAGAVSWDDEFFSSFRVIAK